MRGVNGESTQGWSVEKAVLKIRGPRGSSIALTLRHPDGSIENLSIVRDRILVQSVSTTTPFGTFVDSTGKPVTDLGYIYISEFTQRTPQEVLTLLQDAKAKGYKGLIIDLRSNPGGLLETTVEVTDQFLNSGGILIQVDRDGNERRFDARPGGEALDIPVVILTEKSSASGAEVMAGALQDNKRAIIIGEQTFGKGTVNHLRE